MGTRCYLSYTFATNWTYIETCYLVWTLQIWFQYNASFMLCRTKYTFLFYIFFLLCSLYNFPSHFVFCFWLQVSHCTPAVQRIVFFLIRLNSQPKCIWKRIAQKWLEIQRDTLDRTWTQSDFVASFFHCKHSLIHPVDGPEVVEGRSHFRFRQLFEKRSV